MSMVKRLLEEREANEQWAERLLIETGALQECEFHDYVLDQLDPGAVEEAEELARKDPPNGMPPDEAAEFVREALNNYGEECPGCASRHRD